MEHTYSVRDTTVNDLPNKVLVKILENIPSKELQPLRTVCSQWNEIIATEFGITVVIKNGNHQAMLDCAVATKAIFDNFTTQFTKPILFSGNLTEAEFKGEIGRQNIVEIFKHCSNLECIQFTNVLLTDIYTRISCPEDLSLPKLNQIKIMINFFQDCLSAGELILIDLLNKIQTDSISSISILTDLEMDNFRFRMMFVPETFHRAGQPVQGANNLPLDVDQPIQQDLIVLDQTPQAQEVNDADRPLTHNTVFNEDDVLQTIHDGFFSVGIVMWREEDDVIPISVNGGAQNTISDREFTIASDIFTEFLLKNHTSIKNLSSNFSECICLGDISHWEENTLEQIQLETAYYSFGETREENEEYKLLRNQHSLKSLNILTLRGDGDEDPFWDDICQALSSSHATLEEVDITIFAFHEWTIELGFLSECSQLKQLCLQQYGRKHGFEVLPTSIEVLKLSGVLFGNELQSIAHRLVNLKLFELSLNVHGDQLDLEFFMQLLRSPKLQKISICSCKISREAMEFIQNTEGLKLDHNQESLVPTENCFIVSVQPNFLRDALYP